MSNPTAIQPKIVIIGGGGGNSTLLKALKNHTDDITALVSMADDGGSTGILRNELGVLPPGDVRMCLVALSQLESEPEIFNYRFGEGSLAGHTLGNLYLAAGEKKTGNFIDAVESASKILQIKGRVLPATLTNSRLVMETAAGKMGGEDTIRDLPVSLSEKPDLSLSPKAAAYPATLQAIHEADVVVIAPGNLYGSILPALIVDGMAGALQSTDAKVIYVANLLNLHHKTTSLHDYVEELERFIGKGVIKYVLYNTDTPSAQILNDFALDIEFPIVVNPEQSDNATYKAVGGRFLSYKGNARNPNDTMTRRSLIRHDAEAVSLAIMKIHHEK